MCSCKFHKLATHPHPTFTAPQASSFPSITSGTQELTLPLGRQGKHMLLIVRQLSVIAGWWDVLLAHWNLAKAITITTLTTALATVYFFNTFCLWEEMKDKCIVIIQKQIIMKSIIWWRDSSSVTQTCSLTLDFKTWGTINVPPGTYFSSDPTFSKFETELCPLLPFKPKGDWYYECKRTFVGGIKVQN